MTPRPLHHPVMLFAALGAGSGALASILTWVIWEAIMPESPFEMPDPTKLPHGYIPGMTFGVVIGTALVRLGWSSGGRAAVFALGATLSCFIAYLAYFVLPEGGPQVGRLPAYPVAGLVSSALGGLLIAATGAALYGFMRQIRVFVAVVLIAAVLGAASDLFGPIITDIGGGIVWKLGAVAFYAVWQGAVAAAIAIGLPHPANAGGKP